MDRLGGPRSALITIIKNLTYHRTVIRTRSMAGLGQEVLGEVVYEAVRGLRVEDPAEYVEVGRIRDSLAVPVTL
jgi:hypothetical protein